MIDKKMEIYKCAKELFSLKGFKNTNIADITKMAGFATGTFYNYYSSKDKLFMEIYLEENAKLKKEIMESIDLDGEPLKLIQELLLRNYRGMSVNPILKEWYNRDSFHKIEQNFRAESGLDQMNFMYDSFLEIVRKWQGDGKIREDLDAEMIMAIFSALVNVDLHKEEIGIQYFPRIMDYLTEFVLKGLAGSKA